MDPYFAFIYRMKLFTLNDLVVNTSQRIARFSLCSPLAVRQATTHTHVDSALFSCHVVLPHIDTTYMKHSTSPNTTGILGVNINRPV
jgi:hypothetical protein